MLHMRRRDFITLLGGAAVAWPLAARAQQPERMRRIGLLFNTHADDPGQQSNLVEFVQALQRLGWTDGRNVRIDTRWAGGDASAIRRHAEDLVALAPDVVVATGNASMGPLLQATRTVPIVFNNVADPVGSGFVDSLARPGGNVTGFLQFEYTLSGKWLELLKQIAPTSGRRDEIGTAPPSSAEYGEDLDAGCTAARRWLGTDRCAAAAQTKTQVGKIGRLSWRARRLMADRVAAWRARLQCILARRRSMIRAQLSWCCARSGLPASRRSVARRRCCAGVRIKPSCSGASGQAAAAPPSSVMNSRRFIR
jgi:ABC transporter substrate binding protein